MKLIRWWGVAAFMILSLLVVGGVYWFAPKMLAKGIEGFGSEALGAKVEVGKVEVSLFPPSVIIENIAAADPAQPMQNLVQSQRLQFAVDSEALLWKKLVVDEMQLLGVSAGGARQTSGELPGGRKTTQIVDDTLAVALPEFEDLDAAAIVEQADLITMQRVETLRQSESRIRKEWEQDIDRDAYQKRVDVINQEFERLSQRLKQNKMNLLADASDWKKLKKSIDRERKKVAGLSDKLKQDRVTISQQLAAVKRGPEDDIAALLSNYGLDKGLDGLIDKYLGPQFTPWVNKALAAVKQLKATGENKPQADPLNVSLGQRVWFTDHQTMPDMLVRHLKVDGQERGINIGGDGFDLGYLPWLTGKPAKLDLRMDGRMQGDFHLVSEWPDRQNMSTQLNSTIQSWPVNSFLLMRTEQGDWLVNSGDLSGKLDGSLTLGSLDLEIAVSIKTPKISSPANLQGWQAQIAEQVNSASQIDLKLVAKGDMNDPQIRVESNLESILQQVIAAQAKQKLAAVSDDLLTNINAKVGDFSELENFTSNLDGWQQELSGADTMLNDLLKQIKF